MTKKKSRISERGSIVNAAAVDFVTMTTKDGGQYELVRGYLEAMQTTERTETARSYGYDLTVLGYASFGEGIQEGEPNYIVSVNGKDTDNLFSRLIPDDAFLPARWNCSRIDIQITVPKDRKTDLAQIAYLHKQNLLGEFNGRGKPSVWSMSSSDGDTMYIGKPSSDKMIRFYDKPLIVNRKSEMWERMEVQLRNDKSNAVFTAIFKNRRELNRKVIHQALKYHFSTLPDGMQSELSTRNAFDNVVAANVEPLQSDKGESGKVKWALALKSAFRASGITRRLRRRTGTRDASRGIGQGIAHRPVCTN